MVKNRQGSPQRNQKAYKGCGFPEISNLYNADLQTSLRIV